MNSRQKPLRVRITLLHLDAVDVFASEREDFFPVYDLGRLATRLCILTGTAEDTNDGTAPTVHDDQTAEQEQGDPLLDSLLYVEPPIKVRLRQISLGSCLKVG